MKKSTEYIQLKCGIKIPIITVFNEEGGDFCVAPIESTRLLFKQAVKSKVNKLSIQSPEPIDREAEIITDYIFYYATHFAKDELMLEEIENSTATGTLTFIKNGKPRK